MSRTLETPPCTSIAAPTSSSWSMFSTICPLYTSRAKAVILALMRRRASRRLTSIWLGISSLTSPMPRALFLPRFHTRLAIGYCVNLPAIFPSASSDCTAVSF